jgi:streptomycin 6-kinase
VQSDSDLSLPANLVASIGSDSDPHRHEWLERLPATVAGIARRWELALGSPFQPGGQCSWVAPARTADGAEVVLKVGWLHPEALHEASALRLWDGNGAVVLRGEEVLSDTIALLLERCEPGTPLGHLPEPDQDVVVCGLLPRLWLRPPARGQAFPSLQAMCGKWADEFDEATPREPTALDPGIARAGLALFRDLPASAGRQVLLATDLHAENILAAQREPWLVIDPKPHVGDPAYDPLQHMLNCDRLLTDPAGLARRLADLLDLDAERLLLWLFARCVIESPGNAPVAGVAARLAP